MSSKRGGGVGFGGAGVPNLITGISDSLPGVSGRVVGIECGPRVLSDCSEIRSSSSAEGERVTHEKGEGERLWKTNERGTNYSTTTTSSTTGLGKTCSCFLLDFTTWWARVEGNTPCRKKDVRM